MGGVYEYVCSAVTELLFGTVFWDYSKFKFNLGGRINLLYCFFWGMAAVVWMRYGYPVVMKCMTRLRSRVRPWMTVLLAVFMAVNMVTSSLALARYDARTSGVPAANAHGTHLSQREKSGKGRVKFAGFPLRFAVETGIICKDKRE